MGHHPPAEAFHDRVEHAAFRDRAVVQIGLFWNALSHSSPQRFFWWQENPIPLSSDQPDKRTFSGHRSMTGIPLERLFSRNRDLPYGHMFDVYEVVQELMSVGVRPSDFSDSIWGPYLLFEFDQIATGQSNGRFLFAGEPFGNAVRAGDFVRSVGDDALSSAWGRMEAEVALMSAAERAERCLEDYVSNFTDTPFLRSMFGVWNLLSRDYKDQWTGSSRQPRVLWAKVERTAEITCPIDLLVPAQYIDRLAGFIDGLPDYASRSTMVGKASLMAAHGLRYLKRLESPFTVVGSPVSLRGVQATDRSEWIIARYVDGAQLLSPDMDDIIVEQRYEIDERAKSHYRQRFKSPVCFIGSGETWRYDPDKKVVVS